MHLMYHQVTKFSLYNAVIQKNLNIKKSPFIQMEGDFTIIININCRPELCKADFTQADRVKRGNAAEAIIGLRF